MMRMFLRSVWLLLLIPGLAYGQTAAHPADSSTNSSDVGAQLDALREALSRTQQQVTAQQQEIQVLKAQLKGGQSGGAGAALITAAEVVPLDSPPNAIPSDVSPDIHNAIAPSLTPSADHQTQQSDQQTPVGSIKLGDAVLTPGGFVDFENIFRTTNTQSNIATNFAAIPFSNTAQGHVSEFRTTAQYSRLNLKLEDNFH